MPNVDRESFGRLVAPSAPHHRALTRLHALFDVLDPEASLEFRTATLVELARWIRSTRSAPLSDDSAPGELPEIARLRLLVRAIEELPPCRESLARVIASVLRDASALNLFAQLGLPADRGLLGETLDRLSRRFLPEAMDPHSVSELVCRLFPSAQDLPWLNATPPELFQRFGQLLSLALPDQRMWRPLDEAVLDALRLIATRVSAVGLYDALLARSPNVPLDESPFFVLPRETDAFVESVHAGDESRLLIARERCHNVVMSCRRTMRAIVKGLEGHGVSVDVVYRLELLDKNLARYADLLEPSLPRSELEHYFVVKQFLIALLDARKNDRALGEILRGSTHMLARKIIERAGETGEHYITTTRGEYLKMLASAGGGGVLTTGTAALKFLVGWAHFAPFIEGALAATNYALSFLVMQFCGFTLATKQPSMTAAALASSLRAYGTNTPPSDPHAQAQNGEASSPDLQRGLTSLVSLIARITRSQLAAAIGNVGLVIPTTLAFDHLYTERQGHSFLDPETAHYVLHSLHPTQSGTIFYATLTGVLLWSGSVFAGWLENWCVYRRIPEAIAQHRYGRFLGRRTMELIGRGLHKNISGIGGNTSLGVLLGMTPVLGKFFGLPLDVRHVTLSTGALTLAASALYAGGLESAQQLRAEVLPAVLGIGVIGVFNFGASFVLALLVALRARQVARGDRLRLLSSIVATFLRSPLQFFFPPRAPFEAPVHGPVTLPPPAAANR
jgi:site-specific recombinase